MSTTNDSLLLEHEAAPPCLASALHVINGEYYSGAERVQDLLAIQLPRSGYEVGFACVKPDRFPRVRQSAVPLFETPMRSRFDLRASWQIADIVRRHGYTLLHAHTPRSALVATIAARLAKVPMVYHVHSPTAQDSTHRMRNWFNATNERIALRGAARLVTVSRSLGKHMQDAGYDESIVNVVPNGVPTPGVLRDATPPSSEWTIGSVALFRPRKGLEVLLAAMALLRKENVPVRLRAIGPFESTEYEGEIRSIVAKEGLEEVVDWTGFTDDVPAELATLDGFVLPSLFGEGLPMVVLEAMATGVPVVATRVQGIPEAIEHDRSGLLAAPGDPAQLAEQIRRLVTGHVDWSALREAAKQRHAEYFSDRAMALGVAAVYEELLNAE